MDDKGNGRKRRGILSINGTKLGKNKVEVLTFKEKNKYKE